MSHSVHLQIITLFLIIFLTSLLPANAVNLPVANNDSATTNQGIPVTIDILANDQTNGRTYTVNVVTSPSHGTVPNPPLNSDKKVVYTPDTLFSGTDSFQYTITNPTGTSNVATVTITVNPGTINLPPVAVPDYFTIPENTQSIQLDVLANDHDPENDPITIESVSGPQHGSAKVTDSKFITYQPFSNYFGTDSFTYTITDGHTHGIVSNVGVTITKVNHPPTADNIHLSMLQDTSTQINLSGNDIDSNSISYSIVSSPSHGTLSGTAPNLTYTPNQGFIGIDIFTYKTFDGSIYSNNAIVEIQISAKKSSAVSLINQSNIQFNTQSSIQTSSYQIPHWIKNNAKWWSDGTMNDNEFLKSIQYMLQNGIIKIPQTRSDSSSSHSIPSWVRNNAGWWATGQISDDEFVKSIQFLVKSGIIVV